MKGFAKKICILIMSYDQVPPNSFMTKASSIAKKNLADPFFYSLTIFTKRSKIDFGRVWNTPINVRFRKPICKRRFTIR